MYRFVALRTIDNPETVMADIEDGNPTLTL